MGHLFEDCRATAVFPPLASPYAGTQVPSPVSTSVSVTSSEVEWSLHHWSGACRVMIRSRLAALVAVLLCCTSRTDRSSPLATLGSCHTFGMADSDRDDPSEEVQDPVAPWARLIAFFLSGVFGTFGTLAVFFSPNQAGTAALLLIAAVLMLLGLQGTPLTKITSGDHSVALAAIRRKARKEIIDAEVNETPEVAGAVAEALDRVVNSHNYSVHSVDQAPEVYERMVLNTIGLLFPDTTVTRPPIDGGFDAIISQGERTLYIDIVYRRNVLDAKAARSKLAVAIRSTSRLLVITNAPLSSQARDINSDSNEIEFITWEGLGDNDILSRAVARNLQ